MLKNIDEQERIERLLKENRALHVELDRLQSNYNELQSEELRARKLLDDVPLGEIVIDENADFISVNKGLEHFLNYDEGELVGKNFADLLVEGHEVHETSFPLFKREGIVKNFTWKMHKKNGDIVNVVHFGIAIYDEENKFKCGRGYLIDITEKVRADETLRKSEREKTLILETISESVIYLDSDKRIIWMNSNAEAHLGKAASDIKGKKCHEVCDIDRNYCTCCPVKKAFKNRKKYYDEIPIRDDKIVCMAVYPVLDKSGSLLGAIQITSDVTEQKLLEKQFLEASVNERKKIGQEIHDGLGQMLTGISFLAAALSEKLSDGGHSEADTAGKIVDYTKSALSMMRGLIQGICPAGIDPKGLMSAFMTLTSNIEQVFKIRCEFICSNNVVIHDYNMANHLYFIAQEAVLNAVKHSDCRKISVIFAKKRDLVLLEIKDNGKGFAHDCGDCQGMGLRIMKYRASLINAKFRIGAETGKGTKITVSVAHPKTD